MYVLFDDYKADRFDDGRMKLEVRFKGRRGDKDYVWVPKWKDLTYIFLLAYTVERLNKGRHFKPLVEVAEDVLKHYKEYIETQKPGHDRWGWKERQASH